MRNFKKNTRGQFAIIAALLIAVLTLPLVLSINQISLNRQQLKYEPVQELVLSITSDLDRCLSHALSIATQKYQEDRSGGLYEAYNNGEKFIFQWARSAIAAYSNLGINMTMETEPSEGGKTDIYWDIKWSSLTGYSQVETTFYLDIDAYGFRGWVGKAGKYIRLTIDPESIKLDEDSTTLNFTIVKSRLYDSTPLPITNLTPESLNRSRVHIRGNFWLDRNNGLAITSLKYLGGGKYTVTFNQRINKHTLGVELTVNTPEDNIIVSAIHRRNMTYTLTLQSQNVNSPVPDTEGKGFIEFEGVDYTLPVNLTVSPETEYRTKYYPDSDFQFENCTITENIKDATLIGSEIIFTVDGNGTLTFFYKPLPKFSVNLDSRQADGSDNHLGSIALNTINYADLPALKVTIKPGTYPIEYEPESPYYFWYWEWSPLVNFSMGNNNYEQFTNITILGDGNITAVYRTTRPPRRVNVAVMLQSFEKTYLEPTCVAAPNLGQIKLGDTEYTLSNLATLSNATIYRLEYIPAEGYVFLNWTTNGNVWVADSTSQVTNLIVNGDGSITAFYRGCKITLNSRQWDNSTFNLGLIILGTHQPPYLNWTYTGVARGNYSLQYIVKNSSYQFQWWEFTGNIVEFEDSYRTSTKATIYEDADLTAVYSFVSKPPPPIAGEWGTLYLAKNPPLLRTDDAMIIPFDALPNSYWTGKESTLPIPPKPSWQYLYINSPEIPENLFLAQQVNVSLYIQLASGKADNITIELSFTYNNTKYVIGNHTFYNLVGEGWYIYHINTTAIDKTNWPYQNAAIIPEGSTCTFMVAVPPDSGTLHIVWSEEKQSRIELF